MGAIDRIFALKIPLFLPFLKDTSIDLTTFLVFSVEIPVLITNSTPPGKILVTPLNFVFQI